MRLLLLTHNLAGVGADYWRAVSISREFAAAGHEVTLIATAAGVRGTRRHSAGAPIRELSFYDPLPTGLRRSGFSPLEALRRIRFLAHAPPDVVLGFGHRPAVTLPSLYARRRSGAVYVGDWADLWGPGGIADERRPPLRSVIGMIDGSLERLARTSADGLIVISEHLLALAQGWGIPKQRIHRTLAGADVDRILPQSKDESRRRFGIDPDVHIMLYSGLSRFDRAHVAPVLAALAPLDPRARLMVVGGEAAPWRAELRQYSLQGRLIHFPHVIHDQLGRVLACADVMLIPFPGRGFNLARFPNRVGDYLAAGRPIVTNPTGELEVLMGRSAAGLLVEPKAEAMAQGVLHLFDDQALAAEMGQRGRRYAEEVMAWPILSADTLRFMESLHPAGAP